MITDPSHLPAPELTDDRRDVLWTALRDTIDAAHLTVSTQSRSFLRRHRPIAVAGLAVVVLASGETADAVRQVSSPPMSNTPFCYSQVSADQSDNAPGSAIMVATPTLPRGATIGSGVIADPVALCRQVYRDGGLKLGVAHLPGSAPRVTNQPVPRRTACVRADGTVAVEPGGPAVCDTVGMTDLTHYLPPSP